MMESQGEKKRKEEKKKFDLVPKLKKKENWETICVLCHNKRKDKDLGRNVSICWKGIDEEGEVDYVEQMENSNINIF